MWGGGWNDEGDEGSASLSDAEHQAVLRQTISGEDDAAGPEMSDAEVQAYLAEKFQEPLDEWRAQFRDALRGATDASKGRQRLEAVAYSAQDLDDLNQRVLQLAPTLSASEVRTVIDMMMREGLFLEEVAKATTGELAKDITPAKMRLWKAIGILVFIAWAVAPGFGNAVFGYPLAMTYGRYRKMKRIAYLPTLVDEALAKADDEQSARPSSGDSPWEGEPRLRPQGN